MTYPRSYVTNFEERKNNKKEGNEGRIHLFSHSTHNTTATFQRPKSFLLRMKVLFVQLNEFIFYQWVLSRIYKKEELFGNNRMFCFGIGYVIVLPRYLEVFDSYNRFLVFFFSFYEMSWGRASFLISLAFDRANKVHRCFWPPPLLFKLLSSLSLSFTRHATDLFLSSFFRKHISSSPAYI